MKRTLLLFALTIQNALITLPLLILAGFLLFIWRSAVQLLAKFFRPGQSIVSGATAGFITESIYTRTSSNIITLGTCNNISVETLKQLFCQRVLSVYDGQGQVYKRLCQTWASFLGYNFWQWNQEFHLDDHIKLYDKKEPELSLPASPTEEDLRRVCGKLITQPYKEGTSPWELYLIENYEYSGQCCLLLRTHHALADGLSLYELWSKIKGTEKPKRSAKYSSSTSVIRALKVALWLPYDMSKTTLNFNTIRQWLGPRGQLSRSYETLWSDPIEWAHIKNIMKMHGVNSNAAVYSVVVAAVVRIIKLASDVKIPRQISCSSPYPLKNHPGGLTNYMSTSNFEITLSQCEGEREELIKQVGNQVKASSVFTTLPQSLNVVTSIFLMLPTRWVKYLYKASSVTTLFMSNVFAQVPFVQDEWNMQVKGLVILGPIIHLDTHINATIVSINGGVARFVVTADKAVLPDGDELAVDFKRIIHEEIQRYGSIVVVNSTQLT